MISSIDFVLPPNLADCSLLTIHIVESIVCHVVAVVQNRNPFQDLKQECLFYSCPVNHYLHNIKVPARVERSVGCVVGVKICWKVLDKVVRILLFEEVLVISLVEC